MSPLVSISYLSSSLSLAFHRAVRELSAGGIRTRKENCLGGRCRLDPSSEMSRIAGGRRQAKEAAGGRLQPARWLVVADPGGAVRQARLRPPAVAATASSHAHRSGAGLDLLMPRSCPTTPARSRSEGALAHSSVQRGATTVSTGCPSRRPAGGGSGGRTRPERPWCLLPS